MKNKDIMKRQPKVFVITAPSGTGKSTLNKKLLDKIVTLELSVSLTTRSCRPGEEHGVHYWYIDEEKFKEKIADDQFLEWAEVHGNYYGTEKKELQRILDKGHNPLLEVDVQGWLLLKDKIPDAVAIMILPPSIKTLWERLSFRATESRQVQIKRLQTTRMELEEAASHSAFVINNDLNTCYEELKNFITNEAPLAMTRDEALKHCQKLIQEFDEKKWLNPGSEGSGN